MRRFDRLGRPILTLKDREDIRKLYAEGLSTLKIGRLYERDHTTILSYLKEVKKGKITEIKEEVEDLFEILKKQTQINNDKGLTYNEYLLKDKQKRFKELLHKGGVDK
jgi:IS30 family transposase